MENIIIIIHLYIEDLVRNFKMIIIIITALCMPIAGQKTKANKNIIKKWTYGLETFIFFLFP